MIRTPLYVEVPVSSDRIERSGVVADFCTRGSGDAGHKGPIGNLRTNNTFCDTSLAVTQAPSVAQPAEGVHVDGSCGYFMSKYGGHPAAGRRKV